MKLKRIAFRRGAWIGLMLAAVVACTPKQKPAEPEGEKPKPNIIVFFTDDQGYGDLSCYGATDLKTPAIDSLASSGIRFNQFYVASTVCTPSRAALLTGKYPVRVGLDKEVIFPYSTHGLSPAETTLPELLKPLGYTTACIGKWHLGNLPEYLPNNQGFDYYYGVPYSNDMDRYYYAENNYQSPPLPVYLNKDLIKEGPDQDSLTWMWTQGAVDYIHKNAGHPFFLYLAHNMPHDPWHASANFRGSSERGLYGDVIQEIDWSMSQVIKALKDNHILDNTIVIFTSDNGPKLGMEHGGSAGPLRGGKATTWEGGMRVPGIVSWPGTIPAGINSNEPMSTLDLLPTLVEIAGGEVPDSLVLDGRNVHQFWLDPAQPVAAKFDLLYYGRDGALEAYTDGTWKLHRAKNLGWNEAKQGPFPLSLYKLADDIGETNNQAGQNAEMVSKLQEQMKLASDPVRPETK